MVKVTVENSYASDVMEEGNDYLSGIFEPVFDEITATDLDSDRPIPADIDGIYLRNGHNPLFRPQSGRYHWFDGDSMVHAVAFENGRATYRNRLVLTAGLLAEMEKGKGLFPSLRDGFAAEEGLKNNSGTDIVLHNGEIKTMFSRCGQPYRLDPYTLTTLGPDSFGGAWTKGVSAHSKTDERTGEFIFFNYSFNTAPYMEYGVVSPDNRLLTVTEIELPGARLPHDSWITEQYTVLHDLPLFWDPQLIEQGKKKLSFDRSMRTRFGVIPRYGKGDEIRWFEFEPTYMLHTVNAWEEGDEIVAYGFSLEVPVPEVPEGTPSVKVQNYFLSFLYQKPRLTEYRMNLKTGASSERFVDDTMAEMPCINNRFMGIKSRYAYNTLVSQTPLFVMSGIQKWDFEKMAEVDRYELPEGRYMGQPVFAPKGDATGEDEGYLIAFVSGADKSEVYIWDAQAIGAGPVSIVLLPQRVPGGSHAYFARGQDIRAARERRQHREAA
ncbi:carotenoid cleavage dioxygenase [Sphingobium jiangsuense]|uniref:Dioxygenase n=1 Tax=Sphingobium jiangsuense TaxID=870476 RepID=A0A7W6BQW9_9SPHN|nr:carotenoid oxygenase family protein [Sphingobium jiangsuense]MBB3928390.1 carotenoid cleavage dioxygenase [Sphingobium jiangsuense]GLS99770.1 carotenoid cleavage dioxygenase [Sphingobium jiangsuense]